MTDANSDGSPLEAAAGVIDERTTDAFSLLANETRLAILLALWEAEQPFAEGHWDPIGEFVPFSRLRERVDVRDPGRFNYHLGQLEGTFIEKTEDGYQLLPAGSKIVRTVIAGSGFGEESLETSPIDLNCWNCGASTAITFKNQRLYHVCTDCDGNFDLGGKHPSGALSAKLTNPAALRDRTPEEIYAAVETNSAHDFGKRAAGVCPMCTGPIESRLDVCDNHEPAEDEPCPACGREWRLMAQAVCPVCKHRSTIPLTGLCLHHPAVIAFSWEHGYDVYDVDPETVRWFLRLNEEAEQEIVSTHPLRVQVTLRANDDEVQLTFDETLEVVEVNRDG